EETWDALAECESEGRWSIATGNGFYGGLQFDLDSWQWAGGERYADYPHEATRREQITIAERLLEMHPGGWAAWPACSAQLGLR
ncbi:MAG: transglycosylase family protein, partial [Actinomycetota bacterium]